MDLPINENKENYDPTLKLYSPAKLSSQKRYGVMKALTEARGNNKTHQEGDSPAELASGKKPGKSTKESLGKRNPYSYSSMKEKDGSNFYKLNKFVSFSFKLSINNSGTKLFIQQKVFHKSHKMEHNRTIFNGRQRF